MELELVVELTLKPYENSMNLTQCNLLTLVTTMHPTGLSFLRYVHVNIPAGTDLQELHP